MLANFDARKRRQEPDVVVAGGGSRMEMFEGREPWGSSGPLHNLAPAQACPNPDANGAPPLLRGVDSQEEDDLRPEMEMDGEELEEEGKKKLVWRRSGGRPRGVQRQRPGRFGRALPPLLALFHSFLVCSRTVDAALSTKST